MKTAAEVLDPWLNGDPCGQCDCVKVCKKLQERIDRAIKLAEDRGAKTKKGLLTGPRT